MNKQNIAKNKLFRSMLAGIVGGIILHGLMVPSVSIAQDKNANDKFCIAPGVDYQVAKTIKMMATAYSSTPDQTDDTPFITASGKTVADGIVANNLLPFGTKIRIPDLYGNKVFIVQDRMNQRKGKYHVDIWMSEYQQAKEFGATIVKVEVLQS